MENQTDTTAAESELGEGSEPAELPGGCGYQGHEFGATYPDSICVDGRLYDADYCDGDGNLYEPGEYIPCPQCNREEYINNAAEEIREAGAVAYYQGKPETGCPLRLPRPATSQYSQPERERLAAVWEEGWREGRDEAQNQGLDGNPTPK